MTAAPGPPPPPALGSVEVDLTEAIRSGAGQHPDRGPGAAVARWVHDHRAALDAALLGAGAMLLRGTGIASPADFATVARAACGRLEPYLEGSSERRDLGGGVYTSTEYPADQTVSLHNELSYARHWPRRLCFGCVTSPAEGGETPLADSRRIARELPGDVLDEFTRRGVRYTRNLRSRASPGLGLSWQDVFLTEDRRAVEAHCDRSGIDLEWWGPDMLRLSQARPAVRIHPASGALVWFNQADQFHPTNLGPAVAADLYDVFDEDDLPLNCTYGDGARIDPAMLDEVRAVSWRCAVARRWAPGDVLVVDNMHTAHGRMPFTGDRLVLVAMA